MNVLPWVSFSKSLGRRCFTAHKGIRALFSGYFYFYSFGVRRQWTRGAYGTIIHRSCLGPEPPPANENLTSSLIANNLLAFI